MSQHHEAWRNGGSRRARVRLAATLPAPCCRCGRPVLPTDQWEADHSVPLVRWPEGKPYPDRLIMPAHKSCNRRAGGKDGARITNAMKAQRKNESKGLRAW
jgi:5-methylcytosine-specific restriction endonuclease McrA